MSSDGAISGQTEDLLDRQPFAARLTTAIRGLAGAESVVIGLVGPWGCGKTSIKQMVLEQLGKEDPGIRIVHYEPWLWQNQTDLTTAFFDDIGRVLKTVDDSDSRRPAEEQRRSKRWEAYSKAVNALGIGTKAVAGGLAPVNPALAAVFLAIASGMDGTQALVKAVAEGMASHAAAVAPDLRALRDQVAEAMRELERPILVVIDDIDRLGAAEIPLIFQLVKSNGDFPNLIYLLLYQRETVERALGEYCKGSGREYLEKIVQVPFDVPPPPAGRVKKILGEEIERALGGQKRLWDQSRWDSLYDSHLKSFFSDLRDVRHFMNGFAFHLGMFENGGTLEVNPVDLAALEALRVFEPDVYRTLPDVRGGLLAVPTPLGTTVDRYNAARRPMTALLESIGTDARRSGVRGLIEALFPDSFWMFQEPKKERDEVRPEGWKSRQILSPDVAQREWRACHAPFFDRYFQLLLPEDGLSRAELDALVDVIPDREAFGERIAAAVRRGRGLDALSHLAATVTAQTSDPDVARSLVFRLFECEPYFLRNDLAWASAGGATPGSAVDRLTLGAAEVAQRALRRIPPEKRLDVVVDAGAGKHLVMSWWFELVEERTRPSSYDRMLDTDQYAALVTLWLDAMLSRMETGRLYDVAFWVTLLRRAIILAHPAHPRYTTTLRDDLLDRLRRWLEEEVRTDAGVLRLLPFLSSFIDPNYPVNEPVLDVKGLEMAMDQARLQLLAARMQQGQRPNDEKERERYETFFRLLSAAVRKEPAPLEDAEGEDPPCP